MAAEFHIMLQNLEIKKKLELCFLNKSIPYLFNPDKLMDLALAYNKLGNNEKVS